ncbi:MAG: hypothetical protein IIB17_04505 [Chloroflexi bacterium]|nr:hypothetical protein [Chloroflexota bacterium]
MNQLIKRSVGKAQFCALFIIGVIILAGCSSKPEVPPAEAAPEVIEKPQSIQEPAPPVVAVESVAAQEPVPAASKPMPEYDSSVPAVVAPPSNDSSNEGVVVEANAPEVLLEPVLESDQSELFVEHDAIDAISEELFLEIISPTEEVAFVESPTFVIMARTLIDAAVSVNDDLVDVNEEGVLEWVVNLVEGPNLVEVVASVSGGEEKSAVLTIFYLP